MSTAPPVVLAHGGGAPEALMIGLPLALLAVFGFFEYRARKAEASANRDDTVVPPDRTDDGTTGPEGAP